MRYHKQVKQTYDKEQDTFRHYILIVPCAVLALIVNNELSVTEVRTLWFPISEFRKKNPRSLSWSLQALYVQPGHSEFR